LKGIPVVFHVGALQVHTYGIGLAVTFWFALVYMRRRFRAAGLPWEWLNRAFLWIIGAAIVGARVVHVVANLSYYRQNAGQIFAIWHGGLSSFGGLAFGVATGLWLKRRLAPELDTVAALDVAAPVLMAAWAMGRLFGPQVMIDGGGHPTSAWYGMRYACTIGKTGCLPSGFSVREIPVPLFQSAECFLIFLILRYVEERTGRQPRGVVLAAFAGLWGIVRFTDEFFWLAVPRVWDAVEVTAIVLAVTGWGTMAYLIRRSRRSASDLADGAPPGGSASRGGPYEPVAVPGAGSAGPPLDHEVPGVGPAPED
jgi:phosphatidylglycerol:prolipoprotein diacylglycerol transferase